MSAWIPDGSHAGLESFTGTAGGGEHTSVLGGVLAVHQYGNKSLRLQLSWCLCPLSGTLHNDSFWEIIDCSGPAELLCDGLERLPAGSWTQTPDCLSLEGERAAWDGLRQDCLGTLGQDCLGPLGQGWLASVGQGWLASRTALVSTFRTARVSI